MVTWARPPGGETGDCMTCSANQNRCLDCRKHCHSATSHAQWCLSLWPQQTCSSRLCDNPLRCLKRRRDMHLHVVHKALFRTCCGNRSVKDNAKMLQQIFVKSRKVEKKTPNWVFYPTKVSIESAFDHLVSFLLNRTFPEFVHCFSRIWVSIRLKAEVLWYIKKKRQRPCLFPRSYLKQLQKNIKRKNHFYFDQSVCGIYVRKIQQMNNIKPPQETGDWI